VLKPNPFHVLGLPVDATDEEIVERAHELSELAETDDERLRVLDAQRELITHRSRRLLHQVLEVPRAHYRDRDWDEFAHRNKRDPVDRNALAESAKPLRREDFDVRAVLGLVLDELLRPPPLDIRPALSNPPVLPDRGAPPIEVSDVVLG
jgi:hypothetical protein